WSTRQRAHRKSWCPSRGAASQQHVSDFHKRARFNEVPLPRPIVDVEKYLDDQDLVNVFAVFRQRQEQNLGMTLRGPQLRRDEQTLRIKGTARPHALIVKSEHLRFVFRA